MCQLDGVCLHLCVWPTTYTKVWAGLAYTAFHFPVVISVVLFFGHIEISLDPLLGDANAWDPSFAALPTTSIVQLRVPGTQPPASHGFAGRVQSCAFQACGIYSFILYQQSLSDPTASFTWTRLSVRHLHAART